MSMRLYSDSYESTIGHEAGHLMGLNDGYADSNLYLLEDPNSIGKRMGDRQDDPYEHYPISSYEAGIVAGINPNFNRAFDETTFLNDCKY